MCIRDRYSVTVRFRCWEQDRDFFQSAHARVPLRTVSDSTAAGRVDVRQGANLSGRSQVEGMTTDVKPLDLLQVDWPTHLVPEILSRLLEVDLSAADEALARRRLVKGSVAPSPADTRADPYDAEDDLLAFVVRACLTFAGKRRRGPEGSEITRATVGKRNNSSSGAWCACAVRVRCAPCPCTERRSRADPPRSGGYAAEVERARLEGVACTARGDIAPGRRQRVTRGKKPGDRGAFNACGRLSWR